MRHIIYEYRKWLILGIIMGIILMPIAEAHIIQRDRNRNEVYGELFWKYGLGVYDLSDYILKEQFNVSEDHLLSSYLNLTYEYPLPVLLFYAGLVVVIPGMDGIQHYFINSVLFMFANLDWILMAYIVGERRKECWFRPFSVVYYSYLFGMSVIWGKTEPFVDFIWLVSLYFYKKHDWIKGGFFLGLAAETKIYPAVSAPLFIAMNPLSIIPMLIPFVLSMIPMALTGHTYGALISHLTNNPNYSPYITNPMYVGFIPSNPIAVITNLIVIYAVIHALFDIKKNEQSPLKLEIKRRKDVSIPEMIMMIAPLGLMIIRWVLIWYYLWFLIPTILMSTKEKSRNYLLIIASLGVAHFVGLALNYTYFVVVIQDMFLLFK